MSVYFSKAKINDEQIEVPPVAGWHKAQNMKWIHVLRYKPYSTSNSQTTMFQPELLNEQSNCKLAKIAGDFLCATSEFVSDKTLIKSGCAISSKRGDLVEVSLTESSRVFWDDYEDCLCYFYPANRVFNMPLILSEHDSKDAARGEGWNNNNAQLFEPYQIAKMMDYMLLAHSQNKRFGEEYSQESIDAATGFFDAFKTAGANLSLKYRGDLKWDFYVRGQLYDYLSFKIRETISFALDFYMRLVAVKRNLTSSAICLIENSGVLNENVLKSIFPNVQFIVD